MRRIPARPLILASLLATALAAGSCINAGGPESPQLGQLVLTPHFSRVSAGIVEIAQVHVVLTRAGEETAVLDTVVDVPANAESISLVLQVPVLSNSDVFLMTVQFVTPSGEVAFEAGPVEVTPTTDSTAPPAEVELEVRYVGVGAEAVSVEIQNQNPVVDFGESVTLDAAALGGDGAPLQQTPVAWASLNAARATVPDPKVGQVVAGTERGTVEIVATLLTGPADTVEVTVRAVPATLTVTGGNGQTGSPDATLPTLIEVQVTAADQLPVANAMVNFATNDGGILSPTPVATDINGRAPTQWTLGPGQGTQRATASVEGYPGAEATITAEAAITAASGDVLVLSNFPSGNAEILSSFGARMQGIRFDTMNVALQTPTLQTLMAYRVVLLYEDGLFANSTNVGEVVYQYVQIGGNLILGTFYWQDRSDNTLFLAPGWGSLEIIDPFLGPQGSEYVPDVLDVGSIVSHPITVGVNSLTVPSFHGGVVAKPGTTVLATWSDGVPLVGFVIEGLGQRLVGVSTAPHYNFYGGVTGDFDILWENVIRWALAGSVPSVPANATGQQFRGPRAIPFESPTTTRVGGGSRRGSLER